MDDYSEEPYDTLSPSKRSGANGHSLYKATVQKIISEILPQTGDQPPAFSREARDLLIDCSVEFIRMLSSEANDISEKEAKKTIAVEHIEKALRELGFEAYVQDVVESAGQFKDLQKTRERRVNKMEDSGLSTEQLLRMQEEMFADARQKYTTSATDT